MFDHMTNRAYDLGKLYRAWERHYEALGLGTLRARECAIKKAPVWAEVIVPHLRGGDADKLMERARRRVKESICIELDKCGYFKERTEDLGYATRLHMRLLVCHPKDVKQSRT